MIRTVFFGCLISVMVPACGWSQLRENVAEDAIMLAEQYAFELVQLRANLPAKWAALQERNENHLTRIAEFKVGIGKTSEFTAFHRNRKISLHHVTEASRIDDALSTEPPIDWKTAPFGNADYWVFRQPGLLLFKEQASKWQIRPTVPKTSRPLTDPFCWILCGYTTALYKGFDGSRLDFFFGESRACFAAEEGRKGLLTYWGFPTKRGPAHGTRILFDKHSHLPVQLEWEFYDKGWNPEDYKSLSHRTQEKLTVTYQEFKNVESKLLLPVKIDLVQTSNGFTAHHVELTNRIRWLLNDDVPDSLFEDPSNREVVLPTFPDYPTDQK